MATSNHCRRCLRWHDMTTPCDQGAALRSLLSATPEQQRSADLVERSLLARYRLQRRRDVR